MIYGYARVSTSGQSLYGNGLEAQVEELERNGAQEIYKEVFTGTKKDRPVLDQLMEKLQSGDVLMVTKLDRIARSASGGISLVEELLNRNVTVHILNMGRIDGTPTGRLIFQVFFAFAEFERNMIVTRTQEGKAIARQNPNWREGRPGIEFDHELFYEYTKLVDSGEMTVVDAARKLGIPRTKWYRIRNGTEKIHD